MKVKLFINDKFLKEIEIPDMIPHPYVIGDSGLIFMLSKESNVYHAVSHFNNDSKTLYYENGLVVNTSSDIFERINSYCTYFSCQRDQNDEIAIVHCMHMNNKDTHEGNCKESLCPTGDYTRCADFLI